MFKITYLREGGVPDMDIKREGTGSKFKEHF